MRRAFSGLLLLLLASRVDAGQVLTFSEEGTRDGKPYRSTLTLRVSADGVRAEAADLSAPGGPKAVVYLYLAKENRIVPIDPPTGPVISAATIAAVEERARAAGRRPPGALSVTPLHSTQAFGTWTCDAWAVRRPGQTTEIVCLADPKALGVEEATRTSLRGMSALLVPFVNAMRLAGGDARESVNTYALEGGFPVRTFRSKDGVVEVAAQLSSVESADLPADLFRAPASPGPAPTPSPAPGPTPAPERTITLEGWALRGMPDAARVWTGADYDAAASLLEGVAREDASRLPRESSPVSGALFRRFVDPENLGPARGKGAVDVRAKAGSAVLAGADRISVVYAGAYRDDAARGGELASLIGYTLLAAREVVPLADAAVAASPKKDPLRAARLESRRRTHAALASVVDACLGSLATPGGFQPADRLRLARAVEENVPPLRAYLPEAVSKGLTARLKRMAAAETDPAVRAAFDRTRAALGKRGARVV